MCGGPKLAHSCEPSRPRTTSHVGADSGQHSASASRGTGSVDGGHHGFHQGDIQCRLGNGVDGKA